MTYTYGKSKVKKNAYDVYLRKHSNSPATYGYPPSLNNIIDDSLSASQNQERLGALFNDNSIGFADSDIHTLSASSNFSKSVSQNPDGGDWYNITAADDAVNECLLNAINENDVADGDILVFRHTAGDKDIVLHDEDGDNVSINDIGDVAVFKYDGAKWLFWFFANEGGATPGKSGNIRDYPQKIGVLDESPTITTSDGDSQATNEGNDLTISETAEATATILQVTKDNWEYLRDNLQNEDCDIAFVTEDGADVKALENATFKATFEGTGNDVNKIPITLSKETDDIDDVVVLWNTT